MLAQRGHVGDGGKGGKEGNQSRNECLAGNALRKGGKSDERGHVM